LLGFVSTPQPQQVAPPVEPIPSSIPGPGGTFDFVGVNRAATPNPTSGFAVGYPSFAAAPLFMGALPNGGGGGAGGEEHFMAFFVR